MTQVVQQPSREEYLEWLRHPVTQAYRQFLRTRLQESKDMWAEGCFTRESVEGTVQLNANALGRAEILARLIDLEWETLVEDER